MPAAMMGTQPCCWQQRNHLSQHRNFDGTVHLIFQPAEEGGGGAEDDQRKACLTAFLSMPCSACTTGQASRMVRLPSALDQSWHRANEFKIVLKGRAHAALHTNLDPIPAACQLVQGFKPCQPQQKPIDAGVISVTMVHAGEATNVVPDTWRTAGHGADLLSVEVLDLIEQRMRTMTEHRCRRMGWSTFEFVRNYRLPSTRRTSRRSSVRSCGTLSVRSRVLVQEPTMGAEGRRLYADGAAGLLCSSRQRRRATTVGRPRRGALHVAQPELRFQTMH